MGRVDRVDDFGLARPQQGFAAARRRRPAPARCPRRRRRSPPGVRCSCLHPRAAHLLGAVVERPAGAGGSVERIGEARRRAARPRPRRSSPHCRCTARPGGTLKRRPLLLRQLGQRGADRAVGGDPAGDDQRRGVARLPAPARCGRRGSRSPPAGSSRRCRRDDAAPEATARWTALLRPANEKCGSGEPSKRPRQRHGLGIALAPPAPRSPGPPG